jgi:1-acyl-sn-glycerol-3-phosphate acyltransferase
MSAMDPFRRQVVDFGQDLWYEALRNLMTDPVRRAIGSIEVEGLEHIPEEGPALLVGNHRTTSDPFLLGAVIPRRIHFVVAAFMGRLPLTRELAGVTGNIVLPVSQGGKSQELIRKARSLLKKGRLVGVFPEGMDNFLHSTPAGTVGPFHTTFARLVAALEWPSLPIIPIGLSGHEERILVQIPGALLKLVDPHMPVASDGQVTVPIYRHARIAIGRPLYFTAIPPEGDEHAREHAVHDIVSTVRSAVVALATPEAATAAQSGPASHAPFNVAGFFDETDSL